MGACTKGGRTKNTCFLLVASSLGLLLLKTVRKSFFPSSLPLDKLVKAELLLLARHRPPSRPLLAAVRRAEAVEKGGQSVFPALVVGSHAMEYAITIFHERCCLLVCRCCSLGVLQKKGEKVD